MMEDTSIALLDTLHMPLDDAGPMPGPSTAAAVAPRAMLKRRLSAAFDADELEDAAAPAARKKTKACDDAGGEAAGEGGPQDGARGGAAAGLADELAQELQCGCCAEIVYRPVMVNPCQHFFCGSCCFLWIKNGGTNCPACRGISTSVVPSRPLQAIVDILLRFAPHKTRAEAERRQADEVYRTGQSMRIPLPREPSPEPNVNQNADYARPCPHCLPGNQFGWRCPQPIPDPNTDPDQAWHLDDGTPPGHTYCGNCENLLAIEAPTTTLCDMCRVSFCGIRVQDRCLAMPLLTQHPHGLVDLSDLIQSADVYDGFDGNTVEVEIMLDYLAVHRITPRHIYREIVNHIQAQPRGFAPLIELELFVDVHGVAPAADAPADAPRTRICRMCAAEVVLWGLKDWWVRERARGLLEKSVLERKDCTEGSACGRQKEQAHAREFNHVFATPSSELQPPSLPSLTSLSPSLPDVPPPSHHLHGIFPPVSAAGLSHAVHSSFPVSDMPAPAGPSSSMDAPLLGPPSPFSYAAVAASPPSSQDFRDAVDAML